MSNEVSGWTSWEDVVIVVEAVQSRRSKFDVDARAVSRSSPNKKYSTMGTQ